MPFVVYMCVQGVHSARYKGSGCSVLGIQCLHVCLRTDRIGQDVHDDGRAVGKLWCIFGRLSVAVLAFYNCAMRTL